MIRRSFILPWIGLLCALAWTGGCADLRMWNDDFLDTFQPWGMTAEDQMQGEGPLIVVVENLTRAANHSERANIHISAESRTASGISTTLMSVPAQDRPGNEAYRDTFVLNCKDVQSVSMTATVNRVSVISEDVSGVFVGQPETIYLATEGEEVITRTFMRGDIVDAATVGENVEDSDHSVCRVETTEEGSTVRVDVPVVSTFSAFARDVHFDCGSVLVFGITEGRTGSGAIDWQQYECDYFFGSVSAPQLKTVTGADIVVFSSRLEYSDVDKDGDVDDADVRSIQSDLKSILDIWAEQGEEALDEEQRTYIDELRRLTDKSENLLFNSYFSDPGHYLLNTLFPYPKQYMTIGLALPQFTNLDNIRFLIEEAAEQMTTIPAP